MSEKHVPKDGSSKSAESFHDNPEGAEKAHLEKLKAEAQEASQEQASKDLQELAESVEGKAKSAQETPVENPDQVGDTGMTVLGTQKELKRQAYDRKMKQVRSKLSAPERGFSKFIHQSAVNGVSEASGKTIFRASGVLGGSIVTLLGSMVLLYFAKHYGFTYNYLVFFILFAAGFVLGVLLEMTGKLFKRS